MVTSLNFVHAISRKLIVQCTSNVEEVTLKWSLHEISFILSQKGRDKNCVFITGFGSEAVEATYEDHLLVLKIFVSFVGGVKRAHEDESKDELMDT